MINKELLEFICFFILCGILVAGLWPFRSPPNQVSWLDTKNGLRFGDHGTILSSGILQMTGLQDEPACSLEIWLESGKTRQANSFLAFYTPEHPYLFSLHQELSDLVLEGEVPNQQKETRTAAFYIGGAFRQKTPIFIAIAAGPHKTAVYLDGHLVRASQRFLLSNKNCKGRLIIGNSAVANTGWSGELRGLAIYNRELTGAEILRHYVTWTRKGKPDIANSEGNVWLYLFDEHRGRVVHNKAKLSAGAEAAALQGPDLYIPDRYLVVAPVFLEPPWNEFQPSWSYLEDALINIAGFIPLGFFFQAYFSERKIKRGAAAAIILGGIVSLTIEILQSYLPTRSSDMSDVITNTAGTLLGTMLYGYNPFQTFVREALKRVRKTPVIPNVNA